MGGGVRDDIHSILEPSSTTQDGNKNNERTPFMEAGSQVKVPRESTLVPESMPVIRSNSKNPFLYYPESSSPEDASCSSTPGCPRRPGRRRSVLQRVIVRRASKTRVSVHPRPAPEHSKSKKDTASNLRDSLESEDDKNCEKIQSTKFSPFSVSRREEPVPPPDVTRRDCDAGGGGGPPFLFYNDSSASSSKSSHDDDVDTVREGVYVDDLLSSDSLASSCAQDTTYMMNNSTTATYNHTNSRSPAAKQRQEGKKAADEVIFFDEAARAFVSGPAKQEGEYESSKAALEFLCERIFPHLPQYALHTSLYLLKFFSVVLLENDREGGRGHKKLSGRARLLAILGNSTMGVGHMGHRWTVLLKHLRPYFVDPRHTATNSG
ncbi:unnamed protein product [Amoebophrya sp. A25]|nr:unnamed protein product [Amoebophrya sp. A25]|eukprot:GSA25T00006203001.1